MRHKFVLRELEPGEPMPTLPSPACKHKITYRRDNSVIGLRRCHALFKKRLARLGKCDGIDLRAAEVYADAIAHVRL